MGLLVLFLMFFSGVLWWVPGRILRWVFDRTVARWMPAKPSG